MKIRPDYDIRGSVAEQRTQRAIAWLAPLLPSFAPQEIARWGTAPTWTPPGTRTLVRHMAPDGTRLVTGDRTPVRGFSIEFDLGVVHVHGQPGAARLLRCPDGFLVTPLEGALADGYTDLGYVEQAAFPMLTPLEVRRIPHTGQLTLVSGHADPLFEGTEWVATLGYVDGFPIEPRDVRDTRILRHTRTLWRTLEAGAERHGYAAGDEPEHAVAALGGLWSRPARGFVPLTRRPDGILESPLVQVSAGRPSAKELGRWVAAPLSWSEGRLPERWSMRAAASRARTAPGALARSSADASPEVIGYVYGEPREGWLALYSATHPVTGDQLLTRSELEATDMGYRVDGILGYVSPHGVDLGRTGVETEIKWASRFGQRRRYVESA